MDELAEAVRKDFPIFKRLVDGKPFIYLDSAATSQKPIQVIQSIVSFYEEYCSSVHRGIYRFSEMATETYENAREKVARLINARDSSEVVFVRNTTEAINLVAYSWGMRNLGNGDAILLTEMEHHSNIIPWQVVSRRTHASLEFITFDDGGMLRLEELDNYRKRNVKLFAFTYASNVLGTINPVRELVKFAREIGAITVVDAAQAAPHMPVDVQEIGCDFLAFSGHKMLGPSGIGVLYGRKEILEGVEPFMAGGEMVKEASFTDAAWNEIPWKFEAGTPNIEGAIGLGAAIDYLQRIGMENVRMHEERLTSYAMDELSRLEGISIYGPKDVRKRCGIVSFNVKGMHPHDVAWFLDRDGIAIRAGYHCAMPLHVKLGIRGSARASFYIYNLKSDTDALLSSIKGAIRQLQK